MNRRRFIPLSATLAFAVLMGCQREGGITDPNVDYYTCTMHPSVRSHDPHGKCPICGMDLVPVMKKGLATMATTPAPTAPQLNEFEVPVERQQQIGVTYATVERGSLRRTIRTVGNVVVDRTRQWEFVARAEGYVQKLYVTSPGELVGAGQPLLTIYSPELSTAERELINLLNARDRVTSADGRASNERLIDAAQRRLEQWSVAPEQIGDLEKKRTPSDDVTLHSPFKGVVGNVPVEQGRKVAIGDHLVDIVDLSVVWVWADFYEDEIAALAKGRKVRLTTKSHPNRIFEGMVSLIDPFIGRESRTTRARIDIANADLELRPGMYVNIELDIDQGEGLTIPVGAVLPTGNRWLVFVGKDAGRLEPRFVQLGGKYADRYAVLDGLKEGERVVSSGNFLVDAESKVQGAVKSFEPPAGQETKP
jgi:Cu(I)/Ag(I) efflux system membrane fusion protein